MSLADPQAGARCPDCGHLLVMHRANGVTPDVPLDGPVPCYAPTGREELPSIKYATTYRYTYCQCTYAINQGRTP